MTERIIEVLARGWIECDPNRGGASPDELITDMPQSEFQGQPRWKWFVMRAEALRDYLNDHGLVVRPKENV